MHEVSLAVYLFQFLNIVWNRHISIVFLRKAVLRNKLNVSFKMFFLFRLHTRLNEELADDLVDLQIHLDVRVLLNNRLSDAREENGGNMRKDSDLF